jgi:hypothetical protein
MTDFDALKELREKMMKYRGVYRKKHIESFDQMLENILQTPVQRHEDKRVEWENLRLGMIESYEKLQEENIALQKRIWALEKEKQSG